MILLLLLLARLYHVETVASIRTSRHTHVEVTGRVTLVKKEADGDIHIRLTDGSAFGSPFLIAEIVPAIPLPAPHVGQCVRVCGVRRFDNEAGHGWWELHPVEALAIVPCR